jgi:hypothetical protein
VELHSFSFSFSSHIDTAINGTTGEVPENLEEIDPQFDRDSQCLTLQLEPMIGELQKKEKR